MPPRTKRKTSIRRSEQLYAERNRVERMIGHLRIGCNVATRGDEFVDSFFGTLHLVSTNHWLNPVHTD